MVFSFQLKEQHMAELLAKAFESELTEAEEALFDMLEAEWLSMRRGIDMEDWDCWSPKPRELA